MGRITRLSVRNFRSVSDWVEVSLPPGGPIVVFGENNAGKTNLASALDLVLGERWPGTHRPEDHEFYDRSAENVPMQVVIDVEGVHHHGQYSSDDVIQFAWKFPGEQEQEPLLTMTFAGGQTNRYVSNATRAQCFCLLVSADRRLSYQLSYASQWTFLSKLMRRFHEALVQDPDRVARLKEHFEEIKAIFEGVPEFQVFAEAVTNQVADLSGNFEYQLDIDFSAYDPSNYFRSLRVFPCQDGSIRSFDELGTGQEQILAIAFAWAYARAFHGNEDGLVLIIEEPEAHLHPLAQRWLSKRLHELSAEGLQIVITTHSPAFLLVENLAGLVRVSKTEGATRVHQHTVESFVNHCQQTGASGATPETTLQRYSAWATEEILAGLFARKCVLVEGQTEALALPQLLSKIGYDAEREGAGFIAVGGVGDLAKWWRFFTAYQIPCYAFFDRDEGEDADGQKRQDLMKAAGLDEPTAQAVLESEITVEHARLTMFAADFEGSMTDLFGEAYEALQLQAREEHGLAGGKAKPLLARYVAQRVPMTPKAESFLTRLADRLQGLAPPGTPF